MSETLSAFILGIIQGITEFLPVSSSGHLAVLQGYLKFKGDRLFFDVMLHFATLMAVLIYFRKEILSYLKDSRKLLYVVIACIPTGILGLLLKEKVELLIYHTKIIAIMFLITALINYLVDRIDGKNRLEAIGIKGALFIGIFQGLAVIPGISRSGSTIFASLLTGMERKDAAPFSFIISIPAIAGATSLEVLKVKSPTVNLTFAVGMTSAFITGLISLYLFVKMLKTRRFYYFSVYLTVLGIALLILG